MNLLIRSPRFLYLHGFASGPRSRKAEFFADRLKALGVPLEIPDLAEGDFQNLTVSKQLKLLENIMRDEPAILIGSSLGGYLAALYAARHENIQRLVLLAPAFDFYDLWLRQLGPDRLAYWKQTGFLSVYHYSARQELPISYDLLADAFRFEPYPAVHQPTLIFHGTEDQVVPLEKSIVFAQQATQASLVRLSSGHELTDVLNPIWSQASRFLSEGLS